MPFARNRRGKGGDHVQSAVEGALIHDQDIGSDAGSAEGFVGQGTFLTLRRCVIRDDDQQIEVTIWPPSPRAFEPNR